MLATFALVVLASACTVPSEDNAQRLPPDEVPFQLAETTTTSTAGSAVSQAVAQPVKVFLVRDERLAVVNREASPADPPNVLALLAQGPSQSETDAGLRTALVPNLAKIVETDGDLITIDLDGEFSALAPTEQRLALAQITFAMTQLQAISRVRFLVAGQPASVPRGDGSSTDAPVSPDDYGEFAPT